MNFASPSADSLRNCIGSIKPISTREDLSVRRTDMFCEFLVDRCTFVSKLHWFGRIFRREPGVSVRITDVLSEFHAYLYRFVAKLH